MGTISGTIHLRPARVGLLAQEMTPATVATASQLACSAWGGMYFPILTATDPSLRRVSEVLGLDFWHALDDHPDTLELCNTPGFRWRGRSPWGPFDPARDGLSTRLLSVSSLQWPRGEVYMPHWQEADPNARMYETWLGRHHHDPACADNSSSYCHAGQLLDMADLAAFNDLADPIVPNTATGVGLTYTGDSRGAAVVLIGDDPLDLVRLWNLRATGADVFPWPSAHRGMFEGAARAWLRRQDTRARAGRNANGERKFIMVSATDRSTDYVELKAIIEEEGFTPFVSDGGLDHWLGRGWTGQHPVQADEERSFSVQVTTSDWRFDVPVPQMLSRTRRHRWPGIVAAQIEMHRELQLPPGRTVSIPALRNLAPLLDDLSENIEPFQRSTGSGRVVGVQADSETLTVALVATITMLGRVFESSGWTVGQSDEGRFATQLVDQLGGPDAATACEPAVRAVLNDVSRATRAKPIAALIQTAEQNRGQWPGPLARRTPREYAANVVYRLLNSKLLLPTLTVRCPRCATDVDMRPEDLAAELRCQLCGSDFPLGLALPHILGMTVRGAGWSCEIDIAATVLDGPTTVVVLGEVKGGREAIDDTDVSNLTRVQDALRDARIDTLVLAATTRDSLTDDERTLLRRVCEAAPERLSRGGSADPALPIVLTSAQLSMPWMSEDHPWRWGEPGGGPLEALALESCRRNLGLVEITYDRTQIDGRHRCVWAEPADVTVGPSA